MLKKLIIYGASDFGCEIMYVAMENKDSYGKYETIAFIDDDIDKIGKKLENVDIISLDMAANLVTKHEVYFIAGVGNTLARKKIVEELVRAIPDQKFAIVIHKSVIMMSNTEIEEGVFIAPGATIAIRCYLKAHSVINQNVSVGHDSVVGKYSIVSPGCILSGRTSIGKTTFLGSNVVTYPGVTIGNNCDVSALNVVTRDLETGKKLMQRANAVILPNG